MVLDRLFKKEKNITTTNWNEKELVAANIVINIFELSVKRGTPLATLVLIVEKWSVSTNYMKVGDPR